MRITDILINLPPDAHEGTIRTSGYPASIVLVNTNDIALVDFYDYSSRRTFHFFVPGPRKVEWEQLTDEQRLTIRVTARQLSVRPFLGKYNDDRHYVLEALCAN